MSRLDLVFSLGDLGPLSLKKCIRLNCRKLESHMPHELPQEQPADSSAPQKGIVIPNNPPNCPRCASGGSATIRAHACLGAPKFGSLIVSSKQQLRHIIWYACADYKYRNCNVPLILASALPVGVAWAGIRIRKPASFHKILVFCHARIRARSSSSKARSTERPPIQSLENIQAVIAVHSAIYVALL